MRGYLYHNIVLVKSNLIAMGVFEALLFGAWTLFVVPVSYKHMTLQTI